MKKQFLAALFIASCSFGAFAQTATQLKGSPPLADASFGHSIANSNNYTVVGAPFDGPGAVYLYNGANLVKKYSNVVTNTYDAFGYAVAVNSNWVGVGSSHRTFVSSLGRTGFAILARIGQGELSYYLFPTDLQEYDRFGTSMALSEDWLAVGAPGQNGNKGAVYLWKQFVSPDGTRGWTSLGKIAPANLTADANFGHAIGIHGDRLVVGAPYSNVGNVYSAGRIYVYKRTNNVWALEYEYTHAQPAANANFGYDVDITSDHLIAGANNFTGTGFAQILKLQNNVWTLKSHLPQLTSSSAFGKSVAIQYNRAVVGAPVQGTGEVHLYTDENGYKHKGTLYTGQGSNDVSLGFSVDIDADWVVAGAIGTKVNNISWTGAAYRMPFYYVFSTGSLRAGEAETDAGTALQETGLLPNPAVGGTVEFNAAARILHVEASSSQGLTTSLHFTGTKIDVSNLASGIYFLKIETEEGSVIKKLVIQ